jgi:23S rRNA pseudouridine1911/1915/1917 synthase
MPGPIGHEETLVASRDEAGARLDQFLAARLPALSRSQIQRLIREGHVQVEAAKSWRASTPVHAGLVARVSIPAPAPATPQPEALPLTVLYDDDDLVVIDKPAGLVVHPSAGHATGTVVNALLHHVGGLSGVGGSQRPGIVHRLDRGTSGVMVVAKHDRAHRELARQFHDREVGKEYVALVWGTPTRGQRVATPIGRDPRHRLKMSSRSTRARPAVTDLLEVEPFRGVSLVRIAIGTGRTHQIRVHLSESGHPIVGDELYGQAKRTLPAHLRALAGLARPFLHAARLTFAHPGDGRRLAFEAPLPPDLAGLLKTLREGPR